MLYNVNLMAGWFHGNLVCKLASGCHWPQVELLMGREGRLPGLLVVRTSH
jgi:hypothetical protein